MSPNPPLPIKVFRNDDAAYQAWCDEHPGGYVVNARRSGRPDLFCLHRTTCDDIRGSRSLKPNPFTGQAYIKICSDSIQALREEGEKRVVAGGFASTRGGNGYCEHCNP
jgi:hypothetical protein